MPGLGESGIFRPLGDLLVSGMEPQTTQLTSANRDSSEHAANVTFFSTPTSIPSRVSVLNVPSYTLFVFMNSADSFSLLPGVIAPIKSPRKHCKKGGRTTIKVTLYARVQDGALITPARRV